MNSTVALERPIRPFGLTRAVPVTIREEDTIPPLTLCPERQVSVTESGRPYVHTPYMTTQTTTQTPYNTKVDSQDMPDYDTAPIIDN